MARVLVVGIATLDWVLEVDHFPAEDEEMRARSMLLRRGGNGANTAVVLAQLGHQVSFAGALADTAQSAPLLADLHGFGVATDACARYPGQPPTSVILLTPSGSRTIVHYRDLPEFSAAHFARIELDAFDWVHFEGRAVAELAQMITRVRALRPQLTLSLELEKPRAGLDMLLPRVDALLAAHALARKLGHTEAHAFLDALRARAPQADIFLGWGAEGGYALDRHGHPYHSPAFPPARVIDTVGAGDTFNAGVIDARLRGESPAQALEHGCRLAGAKCGRLGLRLDT